ncbi:DUF2726 domain-containing protein [Komagataeibacter oboediens]|uniref:DUF2726 domain-containing protein n=1 Tax=Komagataeibacter oboediens TaxID=65958 RepID=A0ABS5SMG7_9PROT|nr:DUF2726 domain-containing protein [Komagataeibacter oboediens]MBL7233133.1 DUF2726 domain-containing protein [Komagataeibacter oboediens]MBT0675417.1 DUF2726 domain-containing protein [Komagataeibacter oboediens]MBT0679664.1 DUF2726 domain-containing protein [Komagataeibacter oboediens]
MDISHLLLTPVRLAVEIGVVGAAIAVVVGAWRRRHGHPPALPPFPPAQQPAPAPPPAPVPAPVADAGFDVPVSMTDYDWAVRLYQPTALLSGWERRVLSTLVAQVPRGYYVCPQVRLADFIVPRGPDRDANRHAFFKIASKSIDFVVTHVQSGTVVLGIELDDGTHAHPERQYRDELVDAAFAHIGIPLLRFSPGGRVDISGYFRAAAV